MQAVISTIMEIILGDFLMLYQIFFSSQVKRSTIISNKKDVCELPHELLNYLKNRSQEITKNQKISKLARIIN